MDVSGMLAVHDEMTGFKKFLDSEHLQYPVFVPIYSESDKKITFDISPIVLRTYNWVYYRFIAEINKESDNSFPRLPHVGEELYNEYLSDHFGSESVIIKVSYGTDMEYTKDITNWLYIVFERIGYYLKSELYNMQKNLFDSIKHTSNSLHTLKVF